MTDNRNFQGSRCGVSARGSRDEWKQKIGLGWDSRDCAVKENGNNKTVHEIEMKTEPGTKQEGERLSSFAITNHHRCKGK